MLIVRFGVAAAVRTATDTFPKVSTPAAAAVWANKLPPPEMSRRAIYDATSSAQVNDIEQVSNAPPEPKSPANAL